MPHYEVTVYSRTPAAAAAPTFVELGPIVLSSGEEGAGGSGGLAWSRELFSDGSITVTTDPSKVQSSIAERLLDMEGKPSELAIFRDGVLRQRGPLVAWQIEGNSLILNARGLLYYCRYMTLTTGQTYSTNQVLIAKSLIDLHQAKTMGNYGLVTSSMTSAGATRTRTYTAAELINVMEEIREIGEAENGFEIDINPGTRVISCFNPTKGTDKSATVALDARGIVTPGFSDSVGAGQFGTAALVAGVVADADPLVQESIDTVSRDLFGLAYVAHTSIGVPNTTELINVAVRTRDIAKRSVFIPPKEFFSLPGATVDDFDVGDTVTIEYDAGFGAMTYVGRVKNIFVSVQEGGQDKLTLEFV